jgi:hypothetical protein
LWSLSGTEAVVNSSPMSCSFVRGFLVIGYLLSTEFLTGNDPGPAGVSATLGETVKKHQFFHRRQSGR